MGYPPRVIELKSLVAGLGRAASSDPLFDSLGSGSCEGHLTVEDANSFEVMEEVVVNAAVMRGGVIVYEWIASSTVAGIDHKSAGDKSLIPCTSGHYFSQIPWGTRS